MKTKARAIGDEAESRVLAHFENLGWKLIERNFLCKAGEIDLILEDPKKTIVFMEVKFRSNPFYGAPQEFVQSKKQARISRAALLFIKMKGYKDRNYRFDIAAASPNGLEHIPNVLSFEGYTL